ncbi:MAG: ABC transporter ATP-binding protein, partial [Desulfocapsaceae bacterium]
QHTSLLNFLTVKETLKCYRQLYKNPEEIDWLVQRCNLDPILKQRNNQLSGGQRQRLMLALALVNRPEMIFLDEPSTGLDPQSRHYLWDIVDEIKADGKTIIMTTHSMEEAQYLCDTIAIMDGGMIIAEGSPSELIAAHCNTNTITLPRKSVETSLTGLGLDYQANESSIFIRTANVDDVLSRLIGAGIELSEMSVQSANLEDVFLRLTGKQLRD